MEFFIQKYISQSFQIDAMHQYTVRVAVSGAHLSSVNGLAVRCIKMHHRIKPAITICLQSISNMLTINTCIQTHRGSVPAFLPTKSSAIRDLCKLD